MDTLSTMTSISTLLASIIVAGTAVIAVMQLREMKQATIAQAYSIVLAYVRAPEAREARKVLVHIHEADFSKWTDEQIQKAEFACSTWDAIGILLRRRVIDPKMITKEWRDSIVRCWENALPMIDAFRKNRGGDFWDDFEWLYKLARSS